MLHEYILPIKEENIKKASPFRKDNHKEMKETIFVKIIDNELYDFNEKHLDISSFSSLISYCAGKHVIFRNEKYDFDKFLIKFIEEEEFINLFGKDEEKRTIKRDNKSLKSSSQEGNYFITREGNIQGGTIYCYNENDNLSPDKVMDALKEIKSYGWNLGRLASASSMAFDLISSKLIVDCVPNIKYGDIDLDFLNAMVQNNKGAMLETMGIGKYRNVHWYDVNKCYFSVLEDLPSLSNTFVKYIKSNEYQPDAVAGWCRCSANTSRRLTVGPFTKRIGVAGKGYHLYNPVGEIEEVWLTKDEIDLERKDIVSVKILEGYWAMPIRENPKPFAIMCRILRNMLNSKNEFVVDIAGSMLHVLWGKLWSRDFETKFWMPMYSSLITARQRVRMFNISLLAGEHGIAIATDCIFSSKELPIESSSEIGGMKYKNIDYLMPVTENFRDRSDKELAWTMEDNNLMMHETKMSLRNQLVTGMENNKIKKIPYGLSKRLSDWKFNKAMLMVNQFRHNPPEEEDTIGLYHNRGKYLPRE